MKKKLQPVRGPRYTGCASCEHSPGWVTVRGHDGVMATNYTRRCSCWFAFHLRLAEAQRTAEGA